MQNVLLAPARVMAGTPGLPPALVFIPTPILFHLGLLVGIVELIVAVVAFWRASKIGLDWLRLFGVGVLLLAIAQLGCKVIARAIFHLPYIYPVGVPFKTAGLILVLYSLLKAVDHPRTKELMILGLGAGAYFLVGSFIAFSILHRFDIWTFHLPHILFLVLGPLIIGFYLLKAYMETGDKTALYFWLGLLIYGIASLIVLISVQFTHISYALTYTLIARALAMVIILLGTI